MSKRQSQGQSISPQTVSQSHLKYLQRTILGPLLFLIYVNDLPNCLLNSQPRMYADDTQLTFAAKTVSNIDSNLNEDLFRVNNWLTANKLTLYTSKTEFMLIGSPSLEIPWCLH